MTFGAELLDLLIAKGPELRAAGYLSVEIGGVKVNLLPKDPEVSEELKKLFNSDNNNKGERGNPLDHPSTYGLPEGTAMPGFQRLIDRKLDER